jgi:coproporphyrinogen III oxidase-like Fe-S oxidoreductase
VVWRGEDYLGIGEGAHGRIGRLRTLNAWSLDPERAGETKVEEVDETADRVERLVFRLRTRDGIDARLRPEWTPTLERFAAEGLLARDGEVFRLTRRGAEVCDSILAELV